jgi:hypothetical protein
VTQSLNETFGGLDLPVEATDVTDTLAPLDPGRDVMLALFAAALNAELTVAWRKVTRGFAPDAGIDRTLPVADTYPGELTPQAMQARQAKFPLLALHRSGEHTYEQQTLELDLLRQPWELHYVLGPLDVAGTRQLQDILQAASKILRRTVERRGHPAYEDGLEQFFPDGTAPFSSAELKGGQAGPAAFAGDEKGTLYHALTLRLETTEIARADAAGSYGPFDGTDYDFGIGDGPLGEGVIHGLLYASTDQETI